MILCKKYYIQLKKNLIFPMVLLLLIHYCKVVKSFDQIIHDKFGGNKDAIIDLLKLSITNVKVCIHMKSRPKDEPLPMIKKEMLKCWDTICYCYSLIDNIEFLYMLANITNDIIEELIYSK